MWFQLWCLVFAAGVIRRPSVNLLCGLRRVSFQPSSNSLVILGRWSNVLPSQIFRYREWPKQQQLINIQLLVLLYLLLQFLTKTYLVF